MIRSTQTWRHSERGAVAGLRLLGIGVLLLAVAAAAIMFNDDQKSDSPAATTTTPVTKTTKPRPKITKPPAATTTSTTLPLETLKCDNQKYALVGTPDSPGILPTDLRKTAEKFGKQALIVSPMLCDVPRNDPAEPPEGLLFVGPFNAVKTACEFIDEISQTQSSDSPKAANPESGSRDGGSASTSSSLPTQPPPSPEWTVRNIRNLTGDPQSCEGKL